MTLSERANVHSRVFTAGLIFLSLGMLFSGPVASISMLLLGINWFAEGNYPERLRIFWKNKPAVILCAFFLLHFIGLAWSSDLDYGLSDVRIKVPLFVLPFIFSTTTRMSSVTFRLFCGIFVLGVIVSTLISLCILKGLLPIAVHDIRDISFFISHIRLSLMICLSIFMLVYFLPRYPSTGLRILFILSILWLVVFLGIIESLTGLSILMIVSVILGVAYFNSHRPLLGRILLGGVLLILGLMVYQVYSISRSFREVKTVRLASLLPVTADGNLYMNDTASLMVENGTYVRLEVCWTELKTGWEKRSSIPFDSKDRKGNMLSSTLLRYMASKGLFKKDSRTFATLSNDDILSIENGITNYKYPNLSSLNARIYETIWEMDVYRKGENPSGHSMTMRIEFWRAGWHIFKQHMLYGTGTGDVKNAFIKQYKTDHSKLEERWQLRGHNQYLAIAIAFGLPGLLFFLFSLIYPLAQGNMYRNYFYAVFFIIMMVSMITEDTLETQAGATFYALFNSVFLFVMPKEV